MRTFSSVQLGGGAALGLWLLALVILAELWGNGRHAAPTPTNAVDQIVARSTPIALPIDDWSLDVFGGDWKPPIESPPGWIPPLAMREPAQQPTDQPVMGTARETGDATLLRKPVNNGCSPGGVRQTFYVRGVQHWRCRY